MIVYLKNFRKGLATNSSSTHSVIYKNKEEMFEDLNIFELNYYDRSDNTIAASREAKIKYVLANIWRDEPLVRILSERFPEMKQYYPLIKAQSKIGVDKDGYWMDDVFGMTYREDLTVKNNLEFNIDFITNIINNDDIIIIGGSDEQNFVYDTIGKHLKEPDPNDYLIKSDIIPNGNYWLAYGRMHYDSNQFKYPAFGRLRFSVSGDDPIPEYPELIDLRITNRCDHDCPFCFMNSNMYEQDASMENIRYILDELMGKTIEFSIGGGNILLYPNLDKLFHLMKDHIINVTINVKDCRTILASEHLTTLFQTCVNGIGISIFDVDDIETVRNFTNIICKDNAIYVSMHIIPEYLGVSKTEAIMNELGYENVLLLGYKTNGRGAFQKYHTFTDDELKLIFENKEPDISCDTTFANRYKEWLMKNYEYARTITWNEGEYSMYIDAITGIAYKSSYQLDKGYTVVPDYCDPKSNWLSLKDAFSNIRKDGGFPVWNGSHYWE